MSGLTSCFDFFDIKKTDPCMSDWHAPRCWSECMSEFCSRWHWNIVRTFPVLCLEPRHSLHCSYLMLINSQAKMSSVCVCVCVWLISHGLGIGRSRQVRKALKQKGDVWSSPEWRCLWKRRRQCAGMQRWLITVNTPLSFPRANSQASHLFTPAGPL